MDLTTLRTAMLEGGVAIRSKTRLQPIGGQGDKVFPPTFGDLVRVKLADGSEHATRYAVETRRIDGEDTLCVLLDSVASQANRLEEALQRAWDAGRVRFPMVRVDFTGETDDDPTLDLSTIGGDGFLTSLEAPHRLADALIRDSTLDGTRFRASGPGREFTEASPHNATAVYRLSPNALTFGMWDSTGPKGGQGAKFQRALVSEIVGVRVALGRKTASRIDPAGIELNAGPIYAASEEGEEWTTDEAMAEMKGGKPVKFSRKAKDTEAGRPSSINHGNIKPSIDSEAGGVTLDYAEQVTTLSFPVLNRLYFPRSVDGKALSGGAKDAAEASARVALAALALAAIAFQREEGFDLRSRCAFVPEGPLALEVIGRDGSVSGPYSLSGDAAATLLADAAGAAEAAGMGWSAEPLDLRPAPMLVELIRRSRRVAAKEDADEDAS
ncbi:MAG: type I-U CRISPR-associated RAMP protein Csb1/Cas7u [Longimicrobiales bacterium]